MLFQKPGYMKEHYVAQGWPITKCPNRNSKATVRTNHIRPSRKASFVELSFSHLRMNQTYIPKRIMKLTAES